jgi:hypothetical protein
MIEYILLQLFNFLTAMPHEPTDTGEDSRTLC